MKKMIAIFTVCILMLSSLFSFTAEASAKQKPATIYINGSELITDVSPVEKGNRTLVPFRAIFEALDAKVTWSQSTKTVGATKGDTTISFRLGSVTAKVNNEEVKLDVSAHTINNRTMVPLRFVAETLGADVRWEQSTRTVYIETSSEVRSAYNVNAKDIADFGDGRDIEISFTKSPDEWTVSHYRILLVKTKDARNFNLDAALDVSLKNYTKVDKNGKNQTITLSSSTRDVDGDPIRSNEAYTAYVLTVGNSIGQNKSVLSVPSPSIILTTGTSVGYISNLRVNDVNNYNDGRDLEVSFTRPNNDSNISNYRILVVKTKDANKFTLADANKVSSRNYTTVSKSGSAGSTITTTLSSTARDTSGDLIKNGVSYTVFILAVGNSSNSNYNRLSSPSSSITLSNNVTTTFAPSNVRVYDVNDYGDGRDLEVSFTRSNDESKVSFYRIFVVRSADVNNFDLNEANKVSSSNSYDVSKTGYDITTTLSSNSRDTRGYLIQNGETYRVFVMAVGNDRAGYQNALSSYSTTITLSSNTSISAPSYVWAADVSDYDDGRDLEVNFYKSSDESKVSKYRIFVVRSGDANRFTLSEANKVRSPNYYEVNPTGRDIRTSLPSNATDVDGNSIRNGIEYRVFVMAVGNNKASYQNALSSGSSTITLVDNTKLEAPTDVRVEQVNGNLQVSFTKSSTNSHVDLYRVFFVKYEDAPNFKLEVAEKINQSGRYHNVSNSWDSNNRIIDNLQPTQDAYGNEIMEREAYQVFVMALGNEKVGYRKALSNPSSTIILKNTTPQEAGGENGNE